MFRMEEEIIQRNDLESKLEEIKVQNMSASPLDESIPQSPELERKNAELTAKVNGIQKQLEITEKKVNFDSIHLAQIIILFLRFLNMRCCSNSCDNRN